MPSLHFPCSDGKVTREHLQVVQLVIRSVVQVQAEDQAHQHRHYLKAMFVIARVKLSDLQVYCVSSGSCGVYWHTLILAQPGTDD